MSTLPNSMLKYTKEVFRCLGVYVFKFLSPIEFVQIFKSCNFLIFQSKNFLIFQFDSTFFKFISKNFIQVVPLSFENLSNFIPFFFDVSNVIEYFILPLGMSNPH